MFLSAALPNRQSNTRYSSVNKWKRRRICKVLFVYDFLGSFIPQEPRIMESVIPEIRRLVYRSAAEATVGEALNGDDVRISFAQQFE